MIPKRLYYIWFGSRTLPAISRKYLQKWQQLNPDFELIKISENQFNINYCRFTQQAYAEGDFAFVSDVARLWVIYHYGGFYIDIDVEPLRPIGNLCKYRQIWAKEDVGMVASGLLFGSEAHAKSLQKILQNYRSARYQSNDLTALTTVKMCSSVLSQYGLKKDKHNNVLTNGGLVLAPEYCAPFHYWGGGKVTGQTISIHHYTDRPNWTHSSRSKINYFLHQTMYYFPAWGEFVRWVANKTRSR